tara:strand:+ start:116 stop:1282 length:1167 start_codon:yes stop_codon:yes gene_type:complete
MPDNVKFKSPVIPNAPIEYNQSLFQRTFNILRIYFNQLDNHLRGELGNTTISGTCDITGNTTVGGTLAVTGTTTLNGATTVNNDLLKVVSTDSGAVDNPILALYRNSSSIAVSDELGALEFRGNDAEGVEHVYGRIYSELSVVGSGSEQANLRFALGRGGSFEDPVIVLRHYALELQTDNDLYLGRRSQINFEGASSNSHETVLYVVDPTQDNTVLLPDVSGTVITSGNLSDITSVGTLSAPVTITSTSTDADLLITTTEQGDTESPIMDLYRNSSSPADNDELGMIRFYGNNDRSFSSGGPEKTLYGSMYVEIADASDGTEDGALKYSKVVGGSQETGNLVTQPANGGLQHPALSSNPSSPANGQTYYNTTDHKLKLYANGAWVDLN